ncbi:hypothetical protein ACH42_01095 [Endozoicomonas sp. (ex Bugula neritina AB1)]|nr:hypothetical protein ACH42_01095 [Endozoicomonas sp. (ex Bugula neritina AB1)]
MVKQRLSIISLGILLVLGGCAMSPQSISVNPKVELAESVKNTADGSVSVTVFDERLSPVVGYRGGVYEATAITTSDNLAVALRSVTEQSLQEMGMTATASHNIPQFQIYLDTLEYKVPDGSYVTQVDVKAKIRAVLFNGSERFEGSYSVDITERVAKAPSDKKNQELVDKVLGDVLGRLFADQKFQNFIRKL